MSNEPSPGEKRAATCPACGSTPCEYWLTKRAYEHLRCAKCGHGFVHPVPPDAEIAGYYTTLDDGLSSDCSWTTEPKHKIQLWTRLLREVRREAGEGPLLDLGCGAGQFLALAVGQGWAQSEGVEISPKAAALARAAVPVGIHEGAWRDVPLERNHYAAVALLDVLEHDPEPTALLRHAFELLRPGGCLILTVPNIRGLSIRSWGANAYVVVPPEHLTYYSRRSLAMVLGGAGFTVVRMFTCDIYLKEWLRCLPARGRGSGQEPRVRYNTAYGLMTGGIALAGISLVNVALGLLGVGDQLVAIARKSPGEDHA